MPYPELRYVNFPIILLLHMIKSFYLDLHPVVKQLPLSMPPEPRISPCDSGIASLGQQQYLRNQKTAYRYAMGSRISQK
ncbi:MAG TPA: hypothetical protein VFS89_03280 [Nitrosospira sp.]|nr:hypothetical protein [Nitrosospira sp.]